jgi:hypothetical protein
MHIQATGGYKQAALMPKFSVKIAWHVPKVISTCSAIFVMISL